MFSYVVGGQVGSGVRRYHILYEDGGQVLKGHNVTDVLDRFEWGSRSFIAERATARTFVHAGVVGWRGKAILLPGRTQSGKTTLTAELARAGAAYLSDEFAVLDGHGRVHPFPKQLSVRDTRGGAQIETPVEAFGAKQRRGPMPPGLIVATSYREGAHWRPRCLSHGHALLELFSNTVSARREPDRAINALGRVVLQAPTLRGVRGDASEAAALILARLEATLAG